MKTVAELSQRQRNRFALLARLGVPLEFKSEGEPWGLSDDLQWDATWLLDDNQDHEDWFVRRARPVKTK